MLVLSTSKLVASSVAVLALACADASAQFGNCWSAVTADVSTVSVTAGGVQTLSIFSNEGPLFFSIIGSFSGIYPSDPSFAYAGLSLRPDRYMRQSYIGMSPLIPGGHPHYAGGHQFATDAQGQATQFIVIPPGIYASLVGRTVRHGIYTIDSTYGQPSCGSNTVSLRFVP